MGKENLESHSPVEMWRLGQSSAGSHAWVLWKGMLRMLHEHHRGGRSVGRTGFASDLPRLTTAAGGDHRRPHGDGGGGVRMRLYLLVCLTGFRRR